MTVISRDSMKRERAGTAKGREGERGNRGRGGGGEVCRSKRLWPLQGLLSVTQYNPSPFPSLPLPVPCSCLTFLLLLDLLSHKARGGVRAIDPPLPLSPFFESVCVHLCITTS